MTVLNRETVIERALCSIFQQTYKNIEFVIVDGASTDDTFFILLKYSDLIDIAISEPDTGIYHGMNKGLSLSTGDYIIFLNSDDWYLPHCIETLVGAAVTNDCDFVCSLAMEMNEYGEKIRDIPMMPYGDNVRLRMPLRHETMLVPRELYSKAGNYDQSYKIIADLKMTQRFYEMGMRCHQIPDYLMCFRKMGAASTLTESFIKERCRLLSEQFSDLANDEIQLLANEYTGCPEDYLVLIQKYRSQVKLVRSIEAFLRLHGVSQDHYKCNDCQTINLLETYSMLNSNNKTLVRRDTGGGGCTRIVGQFERYPDLTGKRAAEGGRRISGGRRTSTSTMPLVSVITVCLNSAKTIEQTIQSILNQTYDNIEYIVVDGASTDGTASILKKYDDKIDYYISEPDGGLYDAMNKGLALAKGDYILILNSDGWYTDDAVMSLVSAKKYSGCDMVSALAQYVDANGKNVNLQPSMSYDASVRFRMPLRHETMLVPAGLYNIHGGYDTRYRIIADFDFTLRLFEAGVTHYEIPRPLLFFRNTGVSSTALDKLAEERFQLLGEQFPFLSQEARKLFSERRNLTPDHVVSLALQHADKPRFIDGLRALVADYIRLGWKKWVNQSIDWAPEKNTDAKAGAVVTPSSLPRPAQAMPRRPGAAQDEEKMFFRIATLCSRDQGGAAIGSHRRIEALRRCGLEVFLYSLVSASGHSYVRRVSAFKEGVTPGDDNTIWQAVRDCSILPAKQIEGFKARDFFSLAGSIVDFRKMLPIFDAADIIHLHWVVGMFDYDHAEVLADKPVVWTLADMNAFTGGCHYSEGCDGFERECRNCPLLGGRSDLAHTSWKIKKAAYARLKRLHVICPSQWMATRAAKSSLLGDRPVHVIPNAFPTDRFTLTNKSVARLKLGLPLDKKFLIFGADNLTNRRKGGEWLKAALSKIAMRHTRDVEILLFGHHAIDLPITSRRLGVIQEEERLALAYSAADAFLSSSLEDNGPLTVGESLLCGTPVVAFPVGVVPDLLQHQKTGYIARYQDADDFATGIDWILDADTQSALRRSMHCRVSASSFHDPLTAAERHIAVYTLLYNNL
jgi:glycosyltransferase involved in cell wall biosynthesis